MIALARFRDTGARSDFDRLTWLQPVPSKTITSCSPFGPTPKPPFDPNKRLFNGAAGWPDLAIDQAARPRSSLARYRLAATADGFALPLPPPPPRQASRPLFLRQCRKELPGKFRDFADQSPLTSQRRRQSIELRGALPVLTYSVATGQHPKPPYYAPDPFQYRALTYVRLSEMPQYS